MSGSNPAGIDQVPRGGETLAWLLAVVPAAVPALAMILVSSGSAAGLPAVRLLGLAASAALVVADKRRIMASGAATAVGLPATSWFLVPPVYLWKRANLLNRSKAQAWTWMGCAVAALVIPVTVFALLASEAVEADGLPGCADDVTTASVESTFNGLPIVRSAGLNAVNLEGQEELGQGPGRNPSTRYCRGTVLASDDNEYPVSYTLELRQERVIIHLQVNAKP